MRWLKTIFGELIGLFIEDGTFAVAIVLWLGLVRFAAPRLLPPTLEAPILFAGLLVILAESVLRAARRR
jgi:hypothetical protein